MQKVASSILASSTLGVLPGLVSDVGFMLGGFVAGEGCFMVTRRLPAYADGGLRPRFVFTCQVAARDRAMLELLRAFLGSGSVYDSPPQRSGWQPTTTFTIGSIPAHRRATIPFATVFLLPSEKRAQFEAWRQALEVHDAARPSRFGKGPSPCSEPGCDRPVRGRGLCRRHYYRVTGY